MSVVVLDESRKRCAQIAEALQKNKSAVVCCQNTNEFLTRASGPKPSRLFMDVESWHGGKSVYVYFDVPRKLSEVPIVFYNAPQEFTGIKDRPRHGQDQILQEPTPVETVIDLIRSSI